MDRLFLVLVVALLVSAAVSQTIFVQVFLTSATCTSNCDFFTSDDPMAYFEVNNDGRKYIRCAGYNCNGMETASTTVPKYLKSFDCADAQVTSVTVCIQAGDDDGCGFANAQCISEAGCDNLGCRVTPPCQVTNLGFCGDGSCAFDQTKTITASGGDGVSANMNYRVVRSGFCPTSAPTREPTTKSPTRQPTKQPTVQPTSFPTDQPTEAPVPTPEPTGAPSGSPTFYPTEFPTSQPTSSPSLEPTNAPIVPVPTPTPTTQAPTLVPTTLAPSKPVSEEEVGIFALIGISAGGALGLGAVFFLMYRKRYTGANSAGEELVEHKLKGEKAGLYGNQPKPPVKPKIETPAEFLGLKPPVLLGRRSNSTLSESSGGEDFVLMRVTHDFEGESTDELSVKKGTMVQVTDMVNEDWAYAFNTATGKGGIIPKQFLQDPEVKVDEML